MQRIIHESTRMNTNKKNQMELHSPSYSLALYSGRGRG